MRRRRAVLAWLSIMVVAQQHGDEYVVSEAMSALVRDLSDGSAESRAIRTP